MFRNLGRMVTILGGVCAILVTGEVMLGEKSTRLAHDPEIRAMQRAPEFASDYSYASSFCVVGACGSDELKALASERRGAASRRAQDIEFE